MKYETCAIQFRYFENGKPTDTEERFLQLLQPMTKKVAELYPGWRVRTILT